MNEILGTCKLTLIDDLGANFFTAKLDHYWAGGQSPLLIRFLLEGLFDGVLYRCVIGITPGQQVKFRVAEL